MSLDDQLASAMEPGARYGVGALAVALRTDYGTTLYALHRMTMFGFVRHHEDDETFSLTDTGEKLHNILSSR